MPIASPRGPLRATVHGRDAQQRLHTQPCQFRHHGQCWVFSPCSPYQVVRATKTECRHILWETLGRLGALWVLRAMPSAALGRGLAACLHPRFPGSPEKNSGFLFCSTF